MSTTKDKCLVPGCERPAGSVRGVCSQCYQNAYRAVHQGKTTWKELEALGMCLPVTRQTGGESAFRKALKKLKESKE